MKIQRHRLEVEELLDGQGVVTESHCSEVEQLLQSKRMKLHYHCKKHCHQPQQQKRLFQRQLLEQKSHLSWKKSILLNCSKLGSI